MTNSSHSKSLEAAKPSLVQRLYYHPWVFRVVYGIVHFIIDNFLGASTWGFAYLQVRYLATFNESYRQHRKQERLKQDLDANGESGAPDWENPKIVGRNRVDAHTPLRAFVSEEAALRFWKGGVGSMLDPCVEASACHKHYLTGRAGCPEGSQPWRFTLVGSPKQVPKGWMQASYADSAEPWVSMMLPCHWQCAGHDQPLYTNTVYPFRFDPPRARRDGAWSTTDCDSFIGASPADPTETSFDPIGENTTGLYRCRFRLPAAWADADGKGVLEDYRYFLVFEGVDSCFYAYLDGEQIGYSQDSCLPAEFEITHQLQSSSLGSDHLLACQVMRWCDGSYLEDQDKWWLSGIYREVHIIRKPRSGMIRDYEIKHRLQWKSAEEPVAIAKYQVDVLVETAARHVTNDDYTVLCKVYLGDALVSEASSAVDVSENRLTVFRNVTAALRVGNHAESEIVPSSSSSSSNLLRSVVSLTGDVSEPRLWSDEVPTLYTIVISLFSKKENRNIDVEAFRTGFRDVKIGSAINTLQLNRRSVMIAGVNRNEFHSTQGRSISLETMIADARQLKQFNFNAVRCSHYPSHELWLSVCDEAGILVIDEANIETHGFQIVGQPIGYLSHQPEWAGAMLSRVTRMVERDKNFTCIIGWSLGNESGVGPNHDQMASWLRSRDTTGRFVQYEGGGSRTDLTDIICPMYRPPEWCSYYAKFDTKRRPVILCEYAHAMGNSSGALAQYWKMFRDRNIPRMQGGFIWDLVDQGLSIQKRGDQVPQFKYGGDFGDVPNSRQFCINGILSPDRIPHPIAFEAKVLQAPLSFELQFESESKSIVLSVLHRRMHRDASDLMLQLSLGCDVFPTAADAREESCFIRVPLVDECGVGACEGKRFSLEEFLLHLIPLMVAKTPCALTDSRPRVEDGWLNVAVFTSEATEWVPKNHLVSEVTLRSPKLLKRIQNTLVAREVEVPTMIPDKPSDTEVTLSASKSQAGDVLVRWSDGGEVTIGANCGRIVSIKVPSSSRTDVITQPIDICLWRAPTDNDCGGAGESYESQWRASGLDCLGRSSAPEHHVKVELVTPGSSEGQVVVKVAWTLRPTKENIIRSPEIPCSVTYTFNAKHRGVEVSYSVDLPSSCPPPPRVGLRFAVPASASRCQWVGLGPHEAYGDRQTCVKMGIFRASVDDLHEPYVVPQESGRRAAPRYVVPFTLAFPEYLALIN
jgi:beta-galactosidase